MKKLFVLLFMFTLLFNGLVFSQMKLTQEQIDRVSRLECKLTFNGDAVVGVRTDGTTDLNKVCTLPPVIALFTAPFSVSYESDFITTAVFTPTGGTSIYDIQSNGVPVELWQSPINPDQVHAVYMTADIGDPGFANRRTKYYYSADRGTTWSFIGEVPSNVRSGYATITGLSDNNVMVANHHTDGISRTFIYVDIFPGLGSWLELDPVLGPHIQAEWPRFIATSNITNPTKMVIISSGNASDTCWTNTGQTLTPPGTFTGWEYLEGADNAERHAIARGQDGRIGITYVAHPNLNPANIGDAYFMESTDDGATFSTPIKIFDGWTGGDSLGAMGGISLVYQYDQPKVVFTVATLSSTPGSYYPGAYSYIRCWSPTFPGSDPNKSVILADSNNVPWVPYYWVASADGLSGICKPNIGLSADGNVLFSGFIIASAFTGGSVDTLSFFDGYFTASGDGGLTWKTPVKITPDSPRRDWTNTSISPYNDNSATDWYANLLIQSDSIPGSFVNHTSNGPSTAQLMFVRIEISMDSIDVSVKNISSEIPGEFRLQQNYPNPFNPTTTIRFDIPSTSNVTLKVYNITGQEVATLINNEVVTAGIKEIDFNAVNLASGIYFYTLKAGDFRDTKKMILLK